MIAMWIIVGIFIALTIAVTLIWVDHYGLTTRIRDLEAWKARVLNSQTTRAGFSSDSPIGGKNRDRRRAPISR